MQGQHISWEVCILKGFMQESKKTWDYQICIYIFIWKFFKKKESNFKTRANVNVKQLKHLYILYNFKKSLEGFWLVLKYNIGTKAVGSLEVWKLLGWGRLINRRKGMSIYLMCLQWKNHNDYLPPQRSSEAYIPSWLTGYGKGKKKNPVGGQ